MVDLTIILPIKDRLEYTKKWLSFAKIYYRDFKIIICDGSKSKFADFKNDKNKFFENLNIEYHEYPFDETVEIYFKKLSDSLKKVSTQFCVLSDNDDFFNPTCLKKSVEFLQNNNDYSTCGGQSIQFSKTINNKLTSFNFFKDAYQKSNEINDSLLRFNDLCKNYTSLPLFYDIHRTSEISESYKLLDEMKTNELQFVEIFPQFCDAMNGKNMKLEELYLIRYIQINESAHREYVKEKGSILARLVFSNFSQDYKKMIQCIIDKFSINHIDKKEKYEPIIIDSLIYFLERFVSLTIEKIKNKKKAVYKSLFNRIYFKIVSMCSMKNKNYKFVNNIKNFLENY